MIFVVFFFIYRLFLPIRPDVQSEDFLNLNATMGAIDNWRSLFTLINFDAVYRRNLKRELAGLLLSHFATRQRASADYSLYEALQRGEIPIPAHIHDFLFSEETQRAGWSFKELIQSIRNTPSKWIRRWTGQETAQHYKMINEVLNFLEISLETKNDEGKFN